MSEKGFLYLISPYSSGGDVDVQEMEFRAKMAAKATAWLMLSERRSAYSPIVEGHALAREVEGLDSTFETWRFHNETMLRASSGAVVLKLPGWMESIGVQAEISRARILGIPVEFMDPIFELAVAPPLPREQGAAA